MTTPGRLVCRHFGVELAAPTVLKIDGLELDEQVTIVADSIAIRSRFVLTSR